MTPDAALQQTQPVPEPALEPAPSDAETLASFTAWAAGLFYWAEVGENPGVRDYWDAFHYVATSLSVGYANIFPVTQAGKIIGAVVMMVGPALSSRALSTTAAEPAPAPPATDPLLLEKLDAILAELKSLNASR